MTIKLTVGPVLGSPISDSANLVDFVSSEMDVLSATTTTIKLSGGGYKATVSGTNFGFTNIGGDSYLNSGTITTVVMTKNGKLAMKLFGMTMNAKDLFDAALAEEGGNKAAIENLFFSDRWIINSNNNADVLLKTTKTPDGVKVNLRANDVINSKGGHDKIFSGDGNDVVRLGSGNDVAWGGKGNDTLRGGAGRDKLLGEVGNDKLFGEGGNDKLIGAKGRDTLDGGKGNDLLIGGAQADVFRFVGDNLGDDRIKDFTDGLDKIKMDFADVNSITQVGSDTVVDYADGTLTLLNFTAGDLSSADFI